MKSFILGLPASLFHNGTLCFYIGAKKDKNKFYVNFKDEDGSAYDVNLTTYQGEYAMMCNELDKLFKAKHPDLMLRGCKRISYDELVDVHRLDENDVVKAIFKQFRSKFNAELKHCYHGKPVAQFVAHPPWDAHRKLSPKMTPPIISSFDELLIWVEMNQL